MLQDPLQDYRWEKKSWKDIKSPTLLSSIWCTCMHDNESINSVQKIFQTLEVMFSSGLKKTARMQPNPLTTKCPGAVYIITCTFPQHGVCVVVVWCATTVVVSAAAAAWCDELVVADGCDELVVLLFVLQWLWICTSSTSHSMNTSTYHNSCLWLHLLKFTSPAHTHLYSFSIVISRILFSLKPM